MSRPDLGSFEVGALYKHRDSDEVCEFIGRLALLEEVVGVFRWVDSDTCVLATQRGYDNGEVFQPLGDAITDDISFDDEHGGES